MVFHRYLIGSLILKPVQSHHKYDMPTFKLLARIYTLTLVRVTRAHGYLGSTGVITATGSY